MLTDTLLIEAGPGEVRGAALAGGRLWEIDHFREIAPDCMGAVHRGRVRRIDPGLNAAFVELGGGWTKDGLLRARDAGPKGGPRRIQQIVQEGATVIVQISGGNATRVAGASDAGKGPAVTTAVALKSAFFDYLPNRRGLVMNSDRSRLQDRLEDILQTGEGLRLSPTFEAELGDAEEQDSDGEDALLSRLREDLAAARRHWNEIKDRVAALEGPDCIAPGPGPVARFLGDHAHGALTQVIVGDPASLKAARDWADAFMPDLAARIAVPRPGTSPFADHEIDGEIEACLESRATFGNGGNLVIEAGETLTAIDINSGGTVGRAGRQEMDVNLAAVAEIARQIRVRALAGPIVIDFLKMPRAADRDRLAQAMEEAVSGDPVRTHIAGFSPLGHLELTRSRRKPSLAERLLAPNRMPYLSTEAACYAALRQVAVPGAIAGGGPVLHVSPDMEKMLLGPLAEALAEAGRQVGQALRVEADPRRSGPSFEVA